MQEKASQIKTAYSKLFNASQLEILDYESIAEEDEFEYIYKPNDDTFLMLSTLKHQIEGFEGNLTVCELGSGSGIISANLNNWLISLNKAPLTHFSIDINMDASLFSKRYYEKYGLNINQINASLFNNFRFKQDSCNCRPDLIIFNPPYVPVEQEEINNEQKYLVEKLKFVRQNRTTKRQKDKNLIAFSYMGGLDGLAITRKILKQLTWNTVFYFIVMGEEGLQTIEKQIVSGAAFSQEHKMQKQFTVMQYGHFYNQHLFVVRVKLQIE